MESIRFCIILFIDISCSNIRKLKLTIPIAHSEVINPVNFSLAGNDKTAKLRERAVVNRYLICEVQECNQFGKFYPEGQVIVTAS